MKGAAGEHEATLAIREDFDLGKGHKSPSWLMPWTSLGYSVGDLVPISSHGVGMEAKLPEHLSSTLALALGLAFGTSLGRASALLSLECLGPLAPH